jgi:hypothetical protein
MQSTASPSIDSAAETARSRWALGHQTFHLYLIGMVSILDELGDCASLSEERVATLLLDLAALFDATSASMKYASSFDSATYDQSIRPSMAPPTARPGFSGLLNVDHKRMISALVSVPGTLEEHFGKATRTWPPSVYDAWSALVGAQQEARRNHVHVCRRLVPNGPSLLRLHAVGKQVSVSQC